MDDSRDQTLAPSRREQRRRRPRGGISVLGVFGELFITGGVLVMLFLVWQLWFNDMIMAQEQSAAAGDISQGFIDKDRQSALDAENNDANSEAGSVAAAPEAYADAVAGTAPADGDPFAVLYVPRFGADYNRTIAEGTGHNVLNSTRLGIGHYPGTQMPGEVGNFAVAAHRSAYGGGMHLIHELQLGDAVYVQTEDGYYTYRYRDMEYVSPASVGVIAPVPHAPDATPLDRLITLTSCNPLYSTAERIIAYGVLESWQPISAGAPTELAPIIAAQAEG